MSVVRPAELPEWVAAREGERPRWVWDDTSRWYPPLLEAGTRVDRALDLRLCRRILRASTSTAETSFAAAPSDDWDLPAPTATRASNALFDLEPATADPDPVVELRRQRIAVEESTDSRQAEPAARGRERRCSRRRRDAVRRAAVESRAPRADPLRRARASPGRGPPRTHGGRAHADARRPRRPDSQSRFARRAAQGPAASGSAGLDHAILGAQRDRASGDRTAAGVQEARPAAERERLELARPVGARRAVPADATCRAGS